MCEHHRTENGKARHCACQPETRMKGFIQPCLLLLLHKKPAHGYELMESFARTGFDQGAPDPGAIYRNLRKLEEDGYVTSSWETEGPGPARRLYKVTPEGEEFLHVWAANIHLQKERLENFLHIYKEHFKK